MIKNSFMIQTLDVLPTKIKPVIGRRSYVDFIISSYPSPYGNYFWFSCGLHSYYCVNMWAENIEEWMRLHPPEEKIKVEIINKTHIFITDKRIEKDWLVPEGICLTDSSININIDGLKYLLDKVEKPYDNYICGCEKEEDYPNIVQTFYESNSNKDDINYCKYCGRKWNVKS